MNLKETIENWPQSMDDALAGTKYKNSHVDSSALLECRLNAAAHQVDLAVLRELVEAAKKAGDLLEALGEDCGTILDDLDAARETAQEWLAKVGEGEMSDFQNKLEDIEGGLELLRMAVAADDSRTELTSRVKDLLKDVQGLQSHFTTAIAEARLQGRKEGLEAAAKAIQQYKTDPMRVIDEVNTITGINPETIGE